MRGIAREAASASALIALAVLAVLLFAAPAFATNGQCLDCHDTAIGVTSAARVDFAAPGVELSRCAACHWKSGHYAHGTYQQCNTCHYSMPARTDFYASVVPTAYGWFSSSASPAQSPEVLHEIHANGSWPAGVTRDPLTGQATDCASCHVAAACDACHGEALPHGPHPSADPAYPGRTYRVARGKPEGSSALDTTSLETVSCADGACHDTAAAASALSETRTEEDAAAFAYAGNWYVKANSFASAGKLRYASKAGNVATISFSGPGSVRLYGLKDAFSGYARISLDGAPAVTLDMHSFSSANNSVVFDTGPLAEGGHTITVEPTGTKNVSSMGTKVYLDYIVRAVPIANSFTPDCASCHPEAEEPHGYTASSHMASAGECDESCHTAEDLDTVHRAAGYTCTDCHSSADATVRTAIAVSDTACDTCHDTTHAYDKSFCYDCHTPALRGYPGKTVADATKHMTVTSSTRALTSYPGTPYVATACANCHDSHGPTQRAEGNALCFGCHDGAGTTKTPPYSYQGQASYAVSGHGTTAIDCKECHAVHAATDTGGAVIASGLNATEPGVCAGSTTQPGCHASGANAANGTNILAALTAAAAPSTHHDVYPGGPGKIVCSSCHDPHTDTAGSQFANPAVAGAPLPNASDRFRDADGRVYALVGAQHDGVPPVMSNLTTGLVSASDPTKLWARWYTNEAATGFVDYGPTTGYGSTVASIYTNYTYHYVSAFTLPVGTTWHYRFRSVDQLGNTSTTQDYTLRTPYTRLTAAPTVTGGAGGSPVTVTWATLGECDTWVDYGPTTSYGSSAGSSAFTTSHSVTLNLPVGIYHLRARSSRDIDNYTSADMVVTVYPGGATAPVLTPVPSNGAIPGPQDIAFSWTQPNTTSAPFTYQLHVWDSNSSPTYDYVSPVLSTTSTTVNLDGDHNYNWTVQAWDKDGQPYPLSAVGTFYLTYYNGGSGTCPFLYTWDGDKYVFESDEFAAGKLGLNTSKGFRKPNPLDYHVLATQPAVKDGALEYKLVEERTEVDYIDQAKLYALEAPGDREIWVERSQAEGVGQFTTLDAVIHTTKHELQPPPSVKHVNTGQDVTAKVAAKDGDYLMLNEDRNNDYNYQTIELDLGDVQDAPMTKLVIDGRTCIPTSIAGRQRSLLFGPQVKFEVQDAAGAWKSVPTTNTILPKPPEFERPFVLDLSKIWISDSRKVRFTYLYKTYLDAILLDTTADVPVTLTELPLLSADLQPHGYNKKSSLGELFEYVYGEPASPPYYYLPGNYTKFGDVTPLLGEIDDKFAIFGGGDEFTLRFAPPAPLPANTNRRFLFLSDGYYKDLKQTIEHTVEPLPFAAMSNFPYPETEHYPDDAEHQAYQAEWNTRYEDGPASTQTEGAVASLIDAADKMFDSIVAGVASVFAPEQESAAVAFDDTVDTTYSVDTDRVSLNVLYAGSSTAVPPIAGWQSASAEAAKPTPTAPGTAVDAAALTNATTANNVFWRTNLTSTDRAYNWQVMRFDVAANLLTGSTGIQLQWRGHGEPTAGYPVKTFLWDFQSSRWVAASEGWGGSNFDLKHMERQAGLESFCLTCHTSTPPAGASGAAALTSINSTWDLDFHGEGAGTGGGTALKAPYVRGNAAISCGTCHDSHGNGSLNHIKSTINGTSGIAVGTGGQYASACGACHQGTVAAYHQQCDDCHFNEHGWGPQINEAWDCAACHQHGEVWVHEDIWCHCDLPSARTF